MSPEGAGSVDHRPLGTPLGDLSGLPRGSVFVIDDPAFGLGGVGEGVGAGGVDVLVGVVEVREHAAGDVAGEGPKKGLALGVVGVIVLDLVALGVVAAVDAAKARVRRRESASGEVLEVDAGALVV